MQVPHIAILAMVKEGDAVIKFCKARR